jgi:hypothetical protein
MADATVADLCDDLVEDHLRRSVPFSADLAEVHEVLFHPYATAQQRETAVARWIQRSQPCLFGRIAAAHDGERLQLCILTDRDLCATDEEISEQIRNSVLAWKRRSVRPDPRIAIPAHGFLLLLASQRVCWAEPNAALARLAEKVLELWGIQCSQEQHGKVFWESLFLEQPGSQMMRRFSVMVDLFAAQGDGRWWTDHRIPGGLAFTANSAGHMAKVREWYENKGEQSEWLTATAMRTIALAQDTAHGKATWLREVGTDGRPFLPDVACPFRNPSALHADIKGKDWTRYGGLFHTDQSVRPEFFRDVPPASTQGTSTGQWLLDFTYLYQASDEDHRRLIEGEPVSSLEVTKVIGSPKDWTQIPARREHPPIVPKRAFGRGWLDRLLETRRAQEGTAEVSRLLNNLQRWTLSEEAFKSLWD